MWPIPPFHCSMSDDGLPSVVEYIIETHSKQRPWSEGFPVKLVWLILWRSVAVVASSCFVDFLMLTNWVPVSFTRTLVWSRSDQCWVVICMAGVDPLWLPVVVCCWSPAVPHARLSRVRGAAQAISRSEVMIGVGVTSIWCSSCFMDYRWTNFHYFHLPFLLHVLCMH